MDNNFKVSELCVRYGLNSRQTVYDRMKDLAISPVKRGEISATDLALMDELDKHIKAGGTIEDFVQAPQVVHPDKISLSSGQLDKPEITEESFAFSALLGLIERLLIAQPPNPPSLLSKFEDLEKIADMNWIMPTSEVARLVGFKPQKSFEYGSFIIERCGKVGRQSGWIVKKITQPIERKDLIVY